MIYLVPHFYSVALQHSPYMRLSSQLPHPRVGVNCNVCLILLFKLFILKAGKLCNVWFLKGNEKIPHFKDQCFTSCSLA